MAVKTKGWFSLSTSTSTSTSTSRSRNIRIRISRHRGGEGLGGFSPPPPPYLLQKNLFIDMFNRFFDKMRFLSKSNWKVKDDELNYFEDILVYIKKLPKSEKSMIHKIILICYLLFVNPATSATRRLKTWLRSIMTQDRFSSLTTLQS